MLTRRLAPLVPALVLALTFLVPASVPASDVRVQGPRPAGPCTNEAARGMPHGGEHDHMKVGHHRYICNFAQSYFDGLRDELEAQQDVVLGEIDVKGDILAVSVAFPESGALFFDVSNPAQPRFLSWYRGAQCETLIIDVDCGAYIDLSSDGKLAFLASQALSVVPSRVPDPGVRPIPEQGIEVVSLEDPENPVLTHVFPVASSSGVHTTNWHRIPEEGPGPRAPGEYVFAIWNPLTDQGDGGVLIARVNRVGPGAQLTPVNRISMAEAHDTFVHNDPLTGRTYLYVAVGLESGFYVYDVTDPANEELLAEWDPTPQCDQDWYSHTADTVVRHGRRYVTIDAELFDLGPQEDQPEGCGEIFGNGDVPGPLWIVDATRFERLGPADDIGDDPNVPALRRASKDAIVVTWRNPAGRAGRNLLFSPHNQTVVGDQIFLSHYHGGIFQLDATAAFRGEKERPREVAFVVPHGAQTRPIYVPEPPPALPFFSAFDIGRSDIWDATYYKGHVLAADMFGGVYSFRPIDEARRELGRRRR